MATLSVVHGADCSSFYVVSGPNMSGKSTYLRQVHQLPCCLPCT